LNCPVFSFIITEKDWKETLSLIDSQFRDYRDMVERRTKEIEEAKDYIDSIIKSMIDTLIAISPKGKILTINQATCELLGYQADELMGKPVGLIFAEEEEEEELFKGTRLEKLIEEGSIRDYDMTYKTKAGEKIPVSFSGSVMRDKEGSLIGVVGIARDMREIKRLMEKEKEFAAAAAAAAKTEKKRAAELEEAYGDLKVLKEQLQDRVNDLSILFEMNRHMQIRLYLSNIVEYVAKSAPETMGVEICVVFFWDEIKDRLIPKAVTGLSPKELENISFLLGEGLEGWVGLEKKLTNIQDVSKDPRWKYKLPYPVDKIKTALFCPILIGERLLGVIGLINKTRERTFNHSDESLLAAIAVQLAVAMENAILYEKVRGLSLDTIRSLVRTIDARDPYTRGHSEQVAQYAVMIAKALNFSQEEIEMVEYAGLLHDTGKIGIPGEILKKPGSLTPEEWDKIKVHPYLSRQILLPVKSLHKILSWIYHHHEKPDGQGYPNGLSEKEIPLEAKILAVADTYSALTSDRPYRKAKSKDEAIEELRRVAGTQLDPKIVEVFIKALGEEDPGEGKL
ncbi:MAG: HD domain-containing phosphohydrolase, partial [Nitrospirota bacterium]